MVSCVAGWACEAVNRAQIESYGLADHVHIINPSSGTALNNSLYDAYARQEPWLGYQWGTNDPALLLDLVRLQEPAYSDQCWRTTRACAYEDATILIGAQSGLPQQAPEVVEFLRHWDFDVDVHLRDVVRWEVDNPGASIEDSALYWLNNNVDTWNKWVTAEAAAGVLAVLTNTPSAPNITTPITVGPDSMTVAWSAPSHDGGFPVAAYDLRYIRTDADETMDANWTVVEEVWTAGGGGSQQYALTDLTGGTRYDVQVRAVNAAAGTGPWSPTAIGTTAPPVVPGAPQYLTAGVAVDEARVDLSWTAPISSGGAKITGYKIESSGDPWVEVYTATGAATTYTDEGTDSNGPTFGVGVMRHYRVSAINSVGTGPPSNVAIATPDACRDPLGLLTAPVTRTGAWADDCDSEALPGSYARYYSFTLAQAGQVEINLTSSADAYLVLRQGEARDGTIEDSNDNVGSRNFNSSINRMLAAGTYTVEATTYFAKQTGDFTLSVRPLQETEDLGPLTRSVDRSNSMWTSDHMSTQQEGSYARSYTFTVNTATHVAINLTAPEDSYLYVLDSNGAVVHESDNVTTRNLNSRIDKTLRAGTYTIEATTYFPGRTGTFHLSIGYFGSSQ